MHSVNIHSSKHYFTDLPNDSLKESCKASSIDNGLDSLANSDSVSVSSSLEGSDTTTPSSPPSVVYCVGEKSKSSACEIPVRNSSRELHVLSSLHGKILEGSFCIRTLKTLPVRFVHFLINQNH
jgi:hypothetical protein